MDTQDGDLTPISSPAPVPTAPPPSPTGHAPSICHSEPPTTAPLWPTSLSRPKRLVWHMTHYCQILTSHLATYLSLDSLHRDALRVGIFVPLEHWKIIDPQIAITNDVVRNLCAVKEELFIKCRDSEDMQMFETLTGWWELVAAAAFAVEICADLPRPAERIEDELDKAWLREAHSQLIGLCHGSVEEGVPGWLGLWEQVPK